MTYLLSKNIRQLMGKIIGATNIPDHCRDTVVMPIHTTMCWNSNYVFRGNLVLDALHEDVEW